MVTLKRNKKTGMVEAYEDGKKVGTIITMGDEITKEKKHGKGDSKPHDRKRSHR
jgi:hypothetical protein